MLEQVRTMWSHIRFALWPSHAFHVSVETHSERATDVVTARVTVRYPNGTPEVYIATGDNEAEALQYLLAEEVDRLESCLSWGPDAIAVLLESLWVISKNLDRAPRHPSWESVYALQAQLRLARGRDGARYLPAILEAARELSDACVK